MFVRNSAAHEPRSSTSTTTGAVQAAVVPDVGAVDAPEREAVERDGEVVRLRNRDDAH
jgi:hypothetical protein